MSISIYGVTFPLWFWLPTALVLVTIAGLAIYGTVLGRRELSAEREAVEEWDDDKPAAPLETAQASEDDLYPAQPAIPAAAGPAPAGSSLADASDAIRADAAAAAGMAAGGTHQLAALTEGETVVEEIERLEARLAVLYDLLGEEIAADVKQVDLMLASGAYATADWLPVAWRPRRMLELSGERM